MAKPTRTVRIVEARETAAGRTFLVEVNELDAAGGIVRQLSRSPVEVGPGRTDEEALAEVRAAMAPYLAPPRAASRAPRRRDLEGDLA